MYLGRSLSEKYAASSHQGKFYLLHSPIHVHVNSTNSETDWNVQWVVKILSETDVHTITAWVKLLKNISHQLNKNRIHHCKIESLITLWEVAATPEWIVDLPSMGGAEAEFLHKSNSMPHSTLQYRKWGNLLEMLSCHLLAVTVVILAVFCSNVFFMYFGV